MENQAGPEKPATELVSMWLVETRHPESWPGWTYLKCRDLAGEILAEARGGPKARAARELTYFLD